MSVDWVKEPPRFFDFAFKVGDRVCVRGDLHGTVTGVPPSFQFVPKGAYRFNVVVDNQTPTYLIADTDLELIMPTLSEAQITFLKDVIIGAVEGGTGYWAVARKYNPEKGYVELADEEELADGRQEWLVVTPEVIYNGLHQLSKARVNPRIATAIGKAWAEATDGDVYAAGMLDADDADVLTQIGLFGEIVYG